MSFSRIPPEWTAQSFGLAATIENQRIILPLKAVACEFSVTAGLVEVQMTQVFRQENPKPLDCDYLFPLPADASVYSCEADFNGRVIRAKVKERGEAVRLAQEKKTEGRRVALVEAERENLFTLTLSNLQPDDLVLVTLKYIQPLRHLADMPSVEIPLCPGIRYLPGNPLIRSNRGKGIVDDTDQVPDASRISPVRMEKEHPDAAFVEIRGRLDGQFVDVASPASPSHNIISRPEGDQVAIRLSDKGEVPDRDFVLRWRETKAERLTTRAWVQDVGEKSFALMEIRAPKASGPPSPMDFYFLLDHSGSMEGIKWQKAALAVQTCVAKLSAGDRVMLTLFSNGSRDFAEQPLPPATLLADANFQRLEQLPPSGGTELGDALGHVLIRAAFYSQGRIKNLILITDAQVGNESALLKIMESAPDFPVHCFGIDLVLNDSLLLALARQQSGTFHSLNPADDVVKVVADLAAAIRHPVLNELRLSDGWEPSVKFLPPLYSEQVFQVSARSSLRHPLALTARNGGGESAVFPVPAQPAAGNAPHLHWCKNRVQTLMSAGDGPAAIALSIQSNLICPLTAFVAWDELEKVAVASHSLMQPSQMTRLFDQAAQPDSSMPRHLKVVRFCGTSSGLTEAGFRSPEQTRLMDAHLKICTQYPQGITKAIVEHSGKMPAEMLPAPFPDPTVRRLAFFSLFREIQSRGGLREPVSLWEQIVHWAFENDVQMLHRSQLVAKLLWELHTQAERRWATYNQLLSQLSELDKKSGNLNGDPARLTRIMGDHNRTEAELARMIETEFHRRVDPGLLADYVRSTHEINQQLEAFAQQHLQPS